MYLPKCRRCSKPIEKQAVSSSDGQLKGKYHRECFNCHTCNKPFPDKSFYVFDGKPFCEYHYHEMNDSLCAAPSCGLPIEGPCAVSHAGARYHPAHLTCEHISFSSAAASSEDDDSDSDNEMRRRIGKHGRKPSRAGGRDRGKRCTARLEEYWEVDGKMLCERHMKKEMEHHARDERALRRVTRFIDLSELR
ncbi:hypothetical protein OF83DRAFT_1113004 [Amylostereum chailletii]|nr:hypothetical protein OF83DRAFT_1113004 [Amylostereum chailletii]